MNKIEVTCRRCGKKAPAEEFKVDHVYKLAVCRVCYTDREKNLPKQKQDSEEKTLSELMKDRKEPQKQEISNKTNNKYEIKKSKLLDDDEELEKAVRKKQEELRKRRENTVRVKLISEKKALYPCQKCGYKFKYNIETQKPIRCPYCEAKINHDIDF